MNLAILSSKDPNDARTPAELVARLEETFQDVHVDAEAGQAHADSELEALYRVKAPQPVIDLAEAGAAGAIWVKVADSGLAIEFLLTPGMNIRIEHEESNLLLLLRIVVALGCQLESCG